MNLSAEKAVRKWPCHRFGRGEMAMVTVAALLLTVGAPSRPAVARKSGLPPWSGLFGMERPQSSRPRRAALVRPVPLPKPRPAEAPVVPEAPPAGKQAPAPGPEAASPPTPPAAPSACRLALTDMVAIAPSIPDIHGPGACGGEDLVRLEAVVLPDQRQVAVRPAAILRCTMASAIADWVRSDLSPQAASLGSPISSLDNLDSFECRGRNRVDGARLSEHGRANALDVRAFGLADGRSIALADRTVPRELRENVLHSVCTRFTTVLGPGSDGYHEDHVHLDLMERRNDYRICEWDVWDPLPQIAPLLPAARPDDAPPRAATAKPDTIKPDTAKPDAATSDGARPDIAASGPAEADPAKSDQVQPEQTKPDQIKSPTKKRR